VGTNYVPTIAHDKKKYQHCNKLGSITAVTTLAIGWLYPI
jgi:hypothetical protein